MYIKTRELHPWGAAANGEQTTHTGEHNTIAPLHWLPMPVPAVCTRPPSPFFKKKKKGKTKQNIYRKTKQLGGGEEAAHNHQQHTHTADSVHTSEQAPRGPGHDTRTCTEGSKGIGGSGLHPQGRTHWSDPADQSGQWQERYSKAAGPRPARLHRGPWQTLPGAMEATDDRRAGHTAQEGVACQAAGPRNSSHRVEGAVP